jgi:hypothetical protein
MSIILQIKKRHAALSIKINRVGVATTEKLLGKMHFWCSKYTNRDAFATRGQNRNLKFNHKPFQKLPLLSFGLFLLHIFHCAFKEKENKSLTTVVGLERPLIIRNWLCACVTINRLVLRWGGG